MVIRAAKRIAAYFSQQRLERRVVKALALKPRGGVFNDRLVLSRMSNRLEVEWRARGLHSWDRDMAPERAAKMFAQQCLADVDAAISRLFVSLPDIDEISLRVLDPVSGAPILSGMVARTQAATTATTASIGMRLKSLGLVYHLANWRFESLEEAVE